MATHHPHVGVFLFVFYMGRRLGIGKGWRRRGGVQRSHVNGLGEFLPLFCVDIFVFSFFLIFMPMEVVREFETRHPFIFVNVYCFHFGVFLFYFNYTPMEVVSPVGMLVYTAVYTLAADGAVFDTPEKN